MLEYRLTKIPFLTDGGYTKLEVYVDGAGPIAYLPVRCAGSIVSANDVQSQISAFEDIYQGERS